MPDVVIIGPLFDGRADSAVDAFCEDAKRELAHQGHADLHKYMDAYFKYPTPYYETQTTVEAIGNAQVVHDRGIIYGPWLAGVGSRNRTTRFKGYPHWRRAVADLRAKAPEMLRRVLSRYIGRMG